VRPTRPIRHLLALFTFAALPVVPVAGLRAQSLTAPPADTGKTKADTAKADSAKVAPDSARGADLFGQKTDLGLQMHGRLESKYNRTRNERCIASQFFTTSSLCNGSFQPNFDFQFDVKTGGTVADRVHVNVDYDSKREFDASNSISLYYEGKKKDWLQRVDVGNVAFDVPATRYITSGIPQGNYGVQAIAQFGRMKVRAIAAQQKGNVQRDRVFNVGTRTQQSVNRDIEDYQIEARRFFFTIDPRRLGGYPNVDILNGVQMRQLAATLPDSVRPTRIALYRLLIGGQPPNPNGPQFRLIGDPGSRRGQVYELLRENVDYYADPSQLWIALARPLSLLNERLVVAYTVRIGGRDTTVVTSGGTPDIQFNGSRDQWASLLWDPNVRPGDPAFNREIRSVYRIGGEDTRRETVAISVLTGASFDQERPVGGLAQTFLQLYGLAQSGNPSTFDVNNRLWPRPGDPIFTLGGSANTRVIRDQYLVFPSLQPFARGGLAQPVSNPSNDAIYNSPNEYLYSPQHPQTVYHIRVKYESDGGGEGNGISLGTNQLRPFSERLTLENGQVLKRDLDYTIDYDVGRVTFLHSDTLFAQPRNVVARFEEQPAFVSTPTNILGLATTMPFKNGDLNFVAISQSQRSTSTRPLLGYESQSALVAGLNGSFSFDAAPLSRLLARLPGADPKAPSRLRIDGEVATSRPQIGGGGQAYLESFEGDGGVNLLLQDPNWYLSSQPALGSRLASRIGGGATLDLTRASTMAWQTNGLNAIGEATTFTLQQIDPLTTLAGSGLTQPEQVLWMTLYPLNIGGAYNDVRKKYQWNVNGTPTGRRWRSIRQVLGSGGAVGVDLTRTQNIVFWALIDTTATRRKRNPTFVVDVGDVSENTVAAGPTQLIVTRNGGLVDSIYSGKAFYGRDTLQSERDAFSRAFNQEKNDIGLPGDVVPRLLYATPDSAGTLANFKTCSSGNTRLARLGDTRTNCTVNNGRLDEWDIDGDNVLNFDSSQREQERLLRYVVDLSDPRSYVRIGGCQHSPADTSVASPRQCWVQVKIPFGTALDTINGGPNIRRVRSLRMTMVSGEGMPDNEFSQVPIARFSLSGAPWTKRSDRVIAGIGGDRTSIGLVTASSIGTADKDSLSGLIYDSPPGVIDQTDQKLSGLQAQRIVINERSMRLTATTLAKYERAEAYYRFPEGPKNFLQYKELRAWAKGRGSGWGRFGELNFYVKIGRDANNFYAYRTPVNSGNGQANWLPEVRVDFEKLQALRARLQNAYLQNRTDSLSCTGADSALIAKSALPVGQFSRRYAACADGYMVYSVDPGVSAPNLASVQELSVGIVRVDSTSLSATRIVPGDTLEVWVDDIRLANITNTAGYAGQMGVNLAAGDVGTLRMNFSHRDPNFRQLGEVPTYVADNTLDVSSVVRLEKFAPQLGLSMPLTVSHSTTANTPLLLQNSDLRGDGIQGLRKPSSAATSVALTVRRIKPLEGGWIAPIVNNLIATTSINSATSTSSYSNGRTNLFTAGLDYSVGGDGAKRPMPGWWTRRLNNLPGWLSGIEFVQALRDAEFRARPAAFRLSSNYAKGDDRRANFSNLAASPTDTARIVNGLTSFWRNSTALELRPFDALSARFEFSSLRDLRHYGDSTATGVVATGERSRVLGFDTGLERERVLTTSYAFAPQFRGWLKPRFDFSSSYALQRDPNARQLLRLDDTTGAFRLPRRVNAVQSLNAGAQIDLARVSGQWISDSTRLRQIGNTLLPVDISFSRTLSSAFDGTPYTPGFGLQFGLNDVGGFLRDHGILATTAGSTQQVSLSTGLRLPYGMTLTARTQRVATRNWIGGANTTASIIDGEQITLPNLILRTSFRPKLIGEIVSSINASASLLVTRQRSAAPSLSSTFNNDIRTSHVLSYPLSTSIVWNDKGGLTTSFSVAQTFRVDSLPGTVADSKQREYSADASRAFKLPAAWEMRSDLRARIGWQQQNAQSFVRNGFAAGAGSRLADNGRQSITLNGDTDIADNLTFSLQSARIVTFDNNLNRRISQIVLSAVLQISFFAGELR
jgi:cell surface protein SprA